ncbi:eukaryotic translation initiation factor 2B [Striga asiatica]|uniref:Eukaryotic translation initiation factor 2B n=1 Tax=Striga asiatica TaxID=4170 RepID=A0A5A7PW47_STRAF|nr:eukaryotic translation initiation factor 2B [Striga asiatica]
MHSTWNMNLAGSRWNSGVRSQGRIIYPVQSTGLNSTVRRLLEMRSFRIQPENMASRPQQVSARRLIYGRRQRRRRRSRGESKMVVVGESRGVCGMVKNVGDNFLWFVVKMIF